MHAAMHSCIMYHELLSCFHVCRHCIEHIVTWAGNPFVAGVRKPCTKGMSRAIIPNRKALVVLPRTRGFLLIFPTCHGSTCHRVVRSVWLPAV